MPATVIGVNDPKAIRRYSALLAVDIARQSYFGRKFMSSGTDGNAPIQLRSDLERDAGDKIQYDLSVQLGMQPIEGDSILEGNEEDLAFYTDSMQIDQMRGGVNTGGRMSRKRTLHDLRQVARARQSEWWARVWDELLFMYLSGTRGVNPDYVFPLSYTGFAGNALSAPDAAHHLYAGAATSLATITSTDVMDLSVIDRMVARAKTMGGGSGGSGEVKIRPIMIDGEAHYVLVLSPAQELSLRTNTNAGQWLDIQKAAAAAEGRKSPIFKGSLGMYNKVVLHDHQAIVHQLGGAGGNIPVDRGLFLGAQAACIAFGSPGTGLRFDWHEESRDNGNQVVITTSGIFGIKKTVFNGFDFGIMTVDSAVPVV